MTVRNWKYSDLLEISEMHARNFSDAWNYGMLADSFLTDEFFGVLIEEPNEGIIGTVAFTVADNFADLVHIVVRGDKRGNGYANILMEALIKECHETERVKLFLEVRKSNTVAISLYKKFGFEKISERKKYYADGEDAVVMMREKH